MTKFLLALLVFFSLAQSAFAISAASGSAPVSTSNPFDASGCPAGTINTPRVCPSYYVLYGNNNCYSPGYVVPAPYNTLQFLQCVPAYKGSGGLIVCDANGVCTGNVFSDANAACQSHGTGPIGNGPGAHIDKLTGNSCASTQCFSNGSCTTTTYDLTSGLPVGSPTTTPPPTPASGVPTTTPTTTPSSGVPTTTPTTTPSSGVSGTGSGGGSTSGGGTATFSGGGTGTSTGTGAPLDLSGLDQQVTQLHIASGIDAIVNDLNTPAGSSVPDLSSDAASSVNAVTALNPAVSDMQGYESSIPWWSWRPSIPALACSPFVGHILTYTVSWDFCPSVLIFQAILGWLLALFTAWELQSVIFRKVD